MTRKPIQIAMAQWDEVGEPPKLVALCDDGTLWELHAAALSEPNGVWIQINNVPQFTAPLGTPKRPEGTDR